MPIPLPAVRYARRWDQRVVRVEAKGAAKSTPCGGKETGMTAGDTVVIVLMIVQIGVAVWAALRR